MTTLANYDVRLKPSLTYMPAPKCLCSVSEPTTHKHRPASPGLFRLRDEDPAEEENPFLQPVSVQFQSETSSAQEDWLSSYHLFDRRGVHPQGVACQPPQSLTIKLTNHLCSPLFTQETYTKPVYKCVLFYITKSCWYWRNTARWLQMSSFSDEHFSSWSLFIWQWFWGTAVERENKSSSSPLQHCWKLCFQVCQFLEVFRSWINASWI